MNWNGKVIILDEAQNSTEKEIITILTRMGKGSKCFVCADPAYTTYADCAGAGEIFEPATVDDCDENS